LSPANANRLKDAHLRKRRLGQLIAGDRSDLLRAGIGVHQLLKGRARAGDDTLYAGSGGDTHQGGAGDDTFHVGDKGSDTIDGIDGGAGQDTVYFDAHAFDADVQLTKTNGVVTEVQFTDTPQTIKLSNVAELIFSDGHHIP
jgi:Ca2+-binding RTX toxin-like protein